MAQNPATACNFFSLHSVSSSIRRGRISVPSISSGGVSTPCILIRTSRFLPSHLTPDNLDKTVPADSSILEMNFDYILENPAFFKNSPLCISEISGVSGIRATCLATRVHSGPETISSNVNNGDEFVTVQNSSGSQKFDLKLLAEILERFSPDFFISAFDSHPVPISLKRIHKSVDRTLKYEKFAVSSSASTDNLPFISAIVGADSLAEKERNIHGISDSSSGIAFCDLHKLPTLEERINLLKSVVSSSSYKKNDFLRIMRGPVSPSELIQYLPHIDVFDTSYVDDITSKGYALQIDFINNISSNENLNMWEDRYFDDFGPLCGSCDCLCCMKYTRAYVHHLFKSHEMLAGVLLMMHNLRQYYKWIEYLKSL